MIAGLLNWLSTTFVGSLITSALSALRQAWADEAARKAERALGAAEQAKADSMAERDIIADNTDKALANAEVVAKPVDRVRNRERLRSGSA